MNVVPEPAVVCPDPASVVVPEPGETCTHHDFVFENLSPTVAVVHTVSAVLTGYVLPAPVVSSSAPLLFSRARRLLTDLASFCGLVTKLKTEEARELVMEAVEKQEHGQGCSFAHRYDQLHLDVRQHLWTPPEPQSSFHVPAFVTGT